MVRSSTTRPWHPCLLQVIGRPILIGNISLEERTMERILSVALLSLLCCFSNSQAQDVHKAIEGTWQFVGGNEKDGNEIKPVHFKKYSVTITASTYTVSVGSTTIVHKYRISGTGSGPKTHNIDLSFNDGEAQYDVLGLISLQDSTLHVSFSGYGSKLRPNGLGVTKSDNAVLSLVLKRQLK
jgi:uncharacterized protein (TIGR03067 family)